MRAHLCGVCGSTPAPGAEYARVGGHTSCVAIGRDGVPPSLVLDAGTGLRRLTRLLDGKAFRGSILLSHLHWDHTHGLPFFAAEDRPGSSVRLLLPEQGADVGPGGAADRRRRGMTGICAPAWTSRIRHPPRLLVMTGS